ncbi:hypothetical protein Sango_0225300, partial [Sesamum angolense]
SCRNFLYLCFDDFDLNGSMMALAEARAAWQRTANRCFVQEDAKRAPKLACCSSVTPSVKQAETGTNTAAAGQDTPSTGSLPPNLPSYSNLSPTQNGGCSSSQVMAIRRV